MKNNLESKVNVIKKHISWNNHCCNTISDIDNCLGPWKSLGAVNIFCCSQHLMLVWTHGRSCTRSAIRAKISSHMQVSRGGEGGQDEEKRECRKLNQSSVTNFHLGSIKYSVTFSTNLKGASYKPVWTATLKRAFQTTAHTAVQPELLKTRIP